MDVSDARRLKTLEQENARLKGLLADAMLKEVAGVVTPDATRAAVTPLCVVFG